MIGPILGGAAPTGPLPWRMLRLSQAQQSEWQNNTSPVRVSSTSQDADGWIELDLENPSPSGGAPDVSAWISWPVLDASGLPLNSSTLSPARVILMLIQRDPTGWPGSAANELVGLGVIDNDGDPTALGSGLLVGMLTPAAAADYTLVAATLASAETAPDCVGSRAAGYCIIAPDQQVLIVAGAQSQAGNVVGGQTAADLQQPTGARRITMIASCGSTDDDGPHTVRFRAWYAVLSTSDLPWSPA